MGWRIKEEMGKGENRPRKEGRERGTSTARNLRDKRSNSRGLDGLVCVSCSVDLLVLLGWVALGGEGIVREEERRGGEGRVREEERREGEGRGRGVEGGRQPSTAGRNLREGWSSCQCLDTDVLECLVEVWVSVPPGRCGEAVGAIGEGS